MQKSLNAAEACEQITVNKVNIFVDKVIENDGGAFFTDDVWGVYGSPDRIWKNPFIETLEQDPEVKRRLQALGYKIELTTFQKLAVTKVGFFVDTKENVTLRKLTISACCKG